MRLAYLVIVFTACDAATSPGAPDAPSGQRTFDVNDVSILFPLPANDSERARFLWLMPRAGEQGPFFPPGAEDMLPALNADLPGSFGYPAAMVTSLRFDPCFPKLGGASCQAQIRLVAQPVITSASGVTMLDDAAAHLFYTLSASEAAIVIDELAAIRALSPVPTTGPLAVHPGLAANITGPIGGAVRALVVEHCRDDNLLRITANSFSNDNWGFAKLDRSGAGFERQPLIGMTSAAMAQAWLRQAQTDDLDDPSGTISPAPADGFTYLLSSASFAGGAPVDPARAATAAARLLAIENPTLTSSDDVDCVSCHLATQARLFARRNGVTFDGANRYQPPGGVDATLELAPQLGGNLGATIAFGYHMHDSTGTQLRLPSISERTVNESAEIAAYLSR